MIKVDKCAGFPLYMPRVGINLQNSENRENVRNVRNNTVLVRNVGLIGDYALFRAGNTRE